MKCKHDLCNNEADVNGFCKYCIQLPSKQCNYCNYQPLSLKEKIIGIFKPVSPIEEWIKQQEQNKE